MLRLLAFVLLVGNAVLLAAHFGAFDRLTGASVPPQREPERLQRQVNPEVVRVVPPQAASAVLAAAAQAAADAASARARVCLEAGPFGAAEVEVAERSLRDTGLAPGSWQALTTEDSGSFVVYMGRYAERDMLQRKLDELKRLKVEAEELKSPPELQPGLALGRFDQRAAADQALAQLTQRGVRTARVLTLRPPQTRTLLRVAADPLLQARLAGLAMPSGPGFMPCAAAAAPTPASAAAAASSPGAAVAAAALPASAATPPSAGAVIAGAARPASVTPASASGPARAASAGR